MPPALIQWDRSGGAGLPNQEVRLTVAGIAACGGSEADLDLFLRLLRYCVDREQQAELPDNGEPIDIRVTRSEVSTALSLDAAPDQELLLRKAYQLLMINGKLSKGAGESPDGDWYFLLDRRIRQYRNVNSISGFLAVETANVDGSTRQPSTVPAPDNVGSNPNPPLQRVRRLWSRIAQHRFASAVSASLLAAAIWQGGTRLVSTGSPAPTSPSRTSSPTAEGNTTTSTIETALRGALLSLSDVPPGWIPTAVHDLSAFEDAGYCDRPPQLSALVQEQRVAYAAGSEGLVERIDHSVGRFSPGGAQRFLDELSQTLAQCRTANDTTRGIPYTGTVELRTVPKLADGTVAVTEHLTGAGIVYNGEVIFIRGGDCVAIVGVSAPFIEANRTLADSLADKAAAKLHGLAC